MKDKTKNPTVAPSSTAPTATSSAHAKVSAPKAGTLVKKKNTAAGDPYKMAKPSRSKVTASGGAAYGIRVSYQKPVAPEAGATQANGRLFPPAMKSAPAFKSGIADHS